MSRHIASTAQYYVSTIKIVSTLKLTMPPIRHAVISASGIAKYSKEPLTASCPAYGLLQNQTCESIDMPPIISISARIHLGFHAVRIITAAGCCAHIWRVAVRPTALAYSRAATLYGVGFKASSYTRLPHIHRYRSKTVKLLHGRWDLRSEASSLHPEASCAAAARESRLPSPMYGAFPVTP